MFSTKDIILTSIARRAILGAYVRGIRVTASAKCNSFASQGCSNFVVKNIIHIFWFVKILIYTCTALVYLSCIFQEVAWQKLWLIQRYLKNSKKDLNILILKRRSISLWGYSISTCFRNIFNYALLVFCLCPTPVSIFTL